MSLVLCELKAMAAKGLQSLASGCVDGLADWLPFVQCPRLCYKGAVAWLIVDQVQVRHVETGRSDRSLNIIQEMEV